jgi:hypothetical protein
MLAHGLLACWKHVMMTAAGLPTYVVCGTGGTRGAHPPDVRHHERLQAFEESYSN